MSPANVPSMDTKPLKERRKNGKKHWTESAGLSDKATDWPLVGRALVGSVLATIVWVLIGADIIFFATRPFPGSRENPKGHLEYYFPDEIEKSPYYICSVPQRDPATGETTCPYNGWKPRKSDGKRGPGIMERIVQGIGDVAGTVAGLSKDVEPAAKSDVQAAESAGQRGGSGDFYSCTRGSTDFDEELPKPPSGPSFPYAHAGGTDDLLNRGWGTASPMTALGYMVAQAFVTARGTMKKLFEELRPGVAGGGIGQGIVMLASGLVAAFGWVGIVIAYIGMMLAILFRAVVGYSTNYVGPHEEVHGMALTSQAKYWLAWCASYIVPVTLGIWAGPLIAACVVARVVFSLIVGPFRTAASRATTARILSCNAPWTMVIFGGTFLYATSSCMNGHEWLGMSIVYSALTFFTLRKWRSRVS